ncbi:DUF58 domain-containing protein [Aquimarina sp. 2-A2]|uniref:DUF58 domain-containing protein n=1 Tax=Aquimarina sp. 2-A2 TaxID=3382644 RepID=UPI00387F2CCE
MYLTDRTYYVLGAIILLFFISYWIVALYPFVWLLCIGIFIIFALDFAALYGLKDGIEGSRELADKFSNGDYNEVQIRLENRYRFRIRTEIIDEIPYQFQKRDFNKTLTVDAASQTQFTYQLKPLARGEYKFGFLNVYISSRIALIKRRYRFEKEYIVKVYPSFIQMKKYDILALDTRSYILGVRKTRRIGHTIDFEQIKEYVTGDDVRSINWKATAKRGSLMINQFQDEKSQPVYSIIDASRVMKMPFNGLSLLDYAINSSLSFSNIAIRKQDKAGLLVFSNTVSSFLPPMGKRSYINVISETLYNIKTAFLDADYGTLYAHVKQKITQRSLLLLYTNFEHFSALERQLPYLRTLAKKHMLVVIFFKNTELDSLINLPGTSIPEIYQQTIALQFAQEKKRMVKELQKYGIQTILTTPQQLTTDTINKYLEIKARGIL